MKLTYSHNVLKIDANKHAMDKPHWMHIKTATIYIEPQDLQLLITKMQEALDRSNSLLGEPSH